MCVCIFKKGILHPYTVRHTALMLNFVLFNIYNIGREMYFKRSKLKKDFYKMY